MVTARKKRAPVFRKKKEPAVPVYDELTCGACRKPLQWPGHTYGELVICRDRLSRDIWEAHQEGELIMSQFS